LARYEPDELRKTVEGAEALHAKKNGVDEESGHKFINIIRLAAPPVSDRQWDISS